jgi:hypothetical protein
MLNLSASLDLTHLFKAELQEADLLMVMRTHFPPVLEWEAAVERASRNPGMITGGNSCDLLGR